MPKVAILMPQLGESIAEAKIVNIHVNSGDTVNTDQEIIEVETSKATMSIPSLCEGTVLEITAQVEETYNIGDTLGYLEVTEEEIARTGVSVVGEEQAPAAESPDTETTTSTSAEEDKVHFKSVEADLHETTQTVTTQSGEGLPVPANLTGAGFFSPRLKARLHDLGLTQTDLVSVVGTGEIGRVTINDLENFVSDLSKKKTTDASMMRLAVADSMKRSWNRPLATAALSLNMEPILTHRKTADPKPGPALYIARALGLALAEYQELTTKLIGNKLIHVDSIDIGIAVEVADGILVPTLTEVDKKSLPELVKTYASFVAAAREGRLPNEAIGQGVATITNFGVFGLDWANPVPLPEQNLIIGLGTAKKKPLWDEEKATFIPSIEADLILTFDHRVLDGGGAGRLLNRLKELLTEPEKL